MATAEPFIHPRTPKETLFYVTFGVKYRHHAHPQGMHPDGYVIIVAPDEDRARMMATIQFGTNWSFIYDHLDVERERFHPQHYSQGVLGVFYAPDDWYPA